MIVCHCNVLTKAAILEAIGKNPLSMPNSPVQVHKCMGCAPQCGRCLTTVRALLEEARITTVAVGCAVCPAQSGCAHNDDHQHHDHPVTAISIPARVAAVAI
jgi:bacterioferritin-associated ferredoxin